MGGPGSGWWARSGKKWTTEDYHEFPMTKLFKAGVVKESAYASGGWEWYYKRYGGREVVSSISCAADTLNEDLAHNYRNMINCKLLSLQRLN